MKFSLGWAIGLVVGVVFAITIHIMSSKPDAVQENKPNVAPNKFTFLGDIDGDRDGYIDLWTGRLTEEIIERICKNAPSDATDQCIAHYTAALKGTGDCDSIAADDPDVCFDGGLNCADQKYSACARCINPDAEEVVDGKDNDCDGELWGEEHYGDLAAIYGECWDGEECDDFDMNTSDDTCVRGVCVGTDNYIRPTSANQPQ